MKIKNSTRAYILFLQVWGALTAGIFYFFYLLHDSFLNAKFSLICWSLTLPIGLYLIRLKTEHDKDSKNILTPALVFTTLILLIITISRLVLFIFHL